VLAQRRARRQRGLSPPVRGHSPMSRVASNASVNKVHTLWRPGMDWDAIGALDPEVKRWSRPTPFVTCCRIGPAGRARVQHEWAEARSHQTPRWRKRDSNPPSAYGNRFGNSPCVIVGLRG
jgi:hypothetical protein